MQSLQSELVTYLKTLSYGYDMDIRKSFSKRTPTYPMISVSEIENKTRTMIHGEELFSNVAYQFDIFSSDMYPLAGEDVCRNIATIMDLGLQTQYGLKRQSLVILPDTTNESLTRISVRYTGILDPINDYIYQ